MPTFIATLSAKGSGKSIKICSKSQLDPYKLRFVTLALFPIDICSEWSNLRQRIAPIGQVAKNVIIILTLNAKGGRQEYINLFKISTGYLIMEVCHFSLLWSIVLISII